MGGTADCGERGVGKNDGIDAIGDANALDAPTDDGEFGIDATVAECWAGIARDRFSEARAAAWSMRTGRSFFSRSRVSNDASGSRDWILSRVSSRLSPVGERS